MDGDVGRYWQIFFYILLIFGGAYFASAESAYVRANKIRLKSAAEDGDKRAKRALYITEHFDKALTTILIGNNIMHLACSSLATVLAIDILGEGHTVLATLVTTVIVFLFSEMLPKSLANTKSETLALAYAPSMSALMKLLQPISFVFVKITDFFSALFGGGQDERMTEEELEHAKLELCESARAVYDSAGAVSSWYSSQIADPEMLTPEQFVEGVRRATAKQVTDAARLYSLDTVYTLAPEEVR